MKGANAKTSDSEPVKRPAARAVGVTVVVRAATVVLLCGLGFQLFDVYREMLAPRPSKIPSGGFPFANPASDRRSGTERLRRPPRLLRCPPLPGARPINGGVLLLRPVDAIVTAEADANTRNRAPKEMRRGSSSADRQRRRSRVVQ